MGLVEACLASAKPGVHPQHNQKKNHNEGGYKRIIVGVTMIRVNYVHVWITPLCN